jgi:hypothetical protein
MSPNQYLKYKFLQRKKTLQKSLSKITRKKNRPIRGRCYDHNFLRFLPIFCEKLAFFSKTNVNVTIFAETSSSWSKNANFFAKFFGENILKNHNIGPWSPCLASVFVIGLIAGVTP